MHAPNDDPRPWAEGEADGAGPEAEGGWPCSAARARRGPPNSHGHPLARGRRTRYFAGGLGRGREDGKDMLRHGPSLRARAALSMTSSAPAAEPRALGLRSSLLAALQRPTSPPVAPRLPGFLACRAEGFLLAGLVHFEVRPGEQVRAYEAVGAFEAAWQWSASSGSDRPRRDVNGGGSLRQMWGLGGGWMRRRRRSAEW